MLKKSALTFFALLLLGAQVWASGSQAPAETTGIVLIPDPYSFPTDRLLRGGSLPM